MAIYRGTGGSVEGISEADILVVTIAQGGTGAQTAAAARTNLGLGTAATTAATDYATAAQGAKADTALQSSAIGVSVQAYNANTVVDSSYVHTDNNYTTTEKTKLSGIAEGAEVNVNADWSASSGDAQILNKPSLATVATSGSYTDLSNKPSLATVATSGSYTDLSNTPTIPTNLDSLTDVVISSASTDQILKFNGTNWVNSSAAGGGSGTVTSVAMSVPTGLAVSGSPITSSGTLALTYDTGYAIPTTAKQTEWDTAYTDRNKWDGGSTGLNAATGRTSLGLGTAATTASTDYATAAQGTKADNALTAANPNFTGNLTGTGDIRLNNGNADGAQLQLASSGYSDWNLDNFSGRFRAYYGSTEYFTINTSGNVGVGTTTPTTALDVNGTVTATSVNTQNTFGFKNRIINGAMMIDQRNAGTSGTAQSTYTVDRFGYYATQASKGTWQQNAGSVTPPAGFKNYLGFTSSSSYSVLSSDVFEFYQIIEGYNVADLGFGAVGAATVTLSFWVRSSLTGTFGGALKNSAGNRSYPFTYTISAANTWEQKTITIAGDTSGTWLTTNGTGIYVQIGLGVGATYSGTAGSWSANNYVTATGATSVVGTSGATFYITGVQLEKGSTATSFDYRPYGTELALCQRYFEKSAPQGTSITSNNAGGLYPVYPLTIPNGAYYATVKFVVTKRATPTITTYPYTTATNTTRFSTDSGTDFAANSASVGGQQETLFSILNASGSSITTGSSYAVIGSWYASAEL